MRVMQPSALGLSAVATPTPDRFACADVSTPYTRRFESPGRTSGMLALDWLMRGVTATPIEMGAQPNKLGCKSIRFALCQNPVAANDEKRRRLRVNTKQRKTISTRSRVE